jgi:hypothetical protein
VAISLSVTGTNYASAVIRGHVVAWLGSSASAARHLPVTTTPQLAAKTELAHGTAMAVTGSAVLLALALVIFAVVIARSPAPAGPGASAPR